ncbi:Hypothetical protein CTO_1011 [Chlamydia trachomatis A2497]|uniref:Uncharacterized protein n=1 Tax=Chlamydia trachomatis serovar A (strain A2497) TaxID=580047 RepID=G4NPN1_CHLT4|nr:Hypothetical protein CTO_1011 [Chlamydia trachomatis A2497]
MKIKFYVIVFSQLAFRVFQLSFLNYNSSKYLTAKLLSIQKVFPILPLTNRLLLDKNRGYENKFLKKVFAA